MTRPLLCLAAALAPLTGGCSYAANRLKDLGDIVAVGGSSGGGVQVRAAATKLISLDVGAQADERLYGWRRRHCEWVESSYGLFIASFWSPMLLWEEAEAWDASYIFRTEKRNVGFVGDSPGVERESWSYYLFLLMKEENGRLVEALDVEVGVSFLIGGFELILSPGQLLDLFAGILTLDPAGDDSTGEQPESATPAPRSS